jgi:DNA-binding GntR family transcriptional regulator
MPVEPVITFRDQPGGSWEAFPDTPPASATAPSAPAKADSWDSFPDKPTRNYGRLAGQAGIGVGEGLIGLGGVIGDIQQIAKKVGSYLPDIPSDPESEKYARKYGRMGDVMSVGQPPEFPTSHDIQGQVEKVTGEFPPAKDQEEADARTVGQFLPAALLGPGSVARKLVTQEAIPAAATIVAGRYSDQNPYVKALAGFLAGGVGAAVSGPNTAEKLLREKIPASVTEQDITRAGQLIDHAQTRGVTLTWPEALSRVTGQPVLTDTQRILESHGQTRPQMQELFSERPAQIDRAARDEFDRMGQMPPYPSTIGPQAGEAAGERLNAVRQDINNAAQPYYQNAESVLLTPAEMTHVRAIPGWEQARDAVRNNPQLNWRVANLPDNSVGFLNEVKKHFDQAAENAGSKFNPGRNHQVQSSNEMAASAVKQIGEAKSADYQIALEIGRQGRQQFLEPLLQGPLGKLAKKDITTQKAIAALFPENPVPGTHGEISDAVSALVQSRPAAAEQLVRAHVEMVFNQAARDLQGGANQFAGAKFAAKLAGGAQQRENLRSAIEALPNGAARWQGFEHLLDIMAATGTRQPKGSLTAFNQLEVQSMSTGGLQELASKGLSPGKWMNFANDAFKSWSLGRNLDQIARIITDPRSGDALRQIVRIPPGSDRALVMAGRLIALGSAATTEQRTKATNQ